MKILIISGFPGAGKTTFIQTMARQSGREIAILENEYGDVGIDGDFLKKDTANGELNIWEMTEGCICCSMKGDFAASVLTIANSVDPEYLVIEPTGVGFLSEIVSNLQQIEYEKIQLLAPVTIVDGNSYLRYRQEYEPLYLDQIRNAHTIIVSKMEQAPPEEKQWLEQQLRQHNASAHIQMEHYSGMSQGEWIRLLETDASGNRLEVQTAEEKDFPDTFSMQDASMRNPESLILMLEELIRGNFGGIVRAKGVVPIEGQLYRFDVADSRYAITGAEPGQKCQVVFIGKGLKRQQLRRYFFRKNKNEKKIALSALTFHGKSRIMAEKGVAGIEGCVLIRQYDQRLRDKRLIRRVTKWRDFCCTKICSRSLFFYGDKA